MSQDNVVSVAPDGDVGDFPVDNFHAFRWKTLELSHQEKREVRAHEIAKLKLKYEWAASIAVYVTLFICAGILIAYFLMSNDPDDRGWAKGLLTAISGALVGRGGKLALQKTLLSRAEEPQMPVQGGSQSSSGPSSAPGTGASGGGP